MPLLIYAKRFIFNKSFSMRNLLCIGMILGLGWLGCRPDPDPPQPTATAQDSVATAWRAHPAIRLDHRFLIAGHATEDHLLLATPDHLLALDTEGQLVVDAAMPGHPLDSWQTPLLGDRVVIFPEATPFVNNDVWVNQLQLKLRDPLRPERYTTLDLSALDSSYTRISSRWGCPLVYTSDHRLYIPMLRLSNSKLDSLQHILVFAITSGSAGPEAELERIVYLRPYAYSESGRFINPSLYRCYSAHAVGNDVYFSFLDPAVTLKASAGPQAEFVAFSSWSMLGGDEDTRFFLGQNANGALSWGERRQGPWQFYTFPVNANSSRDARGSTIQGDLVAYDNYQLARYVFRPDSNFLAIDEIATPGVEGKPRFNDLIAWRDQVYLLTTDGLYHKPDHEFFQFLPPPQ